MAEAKPVVLTNMCMIRDGEKVLVQIRNDKRWERFSRGDTLRTENQ